MVVSDRADVEWPSSLRAPYRAAPSNTTQDKHRIRLSAAVSIDTRRMECDIVKAGTTQRILAAS